MKNSVKLILSILLISKLSFLSAQNVGINTTTPAATLEVKNDNAAQPIFNALSNDTTNRMTILDNGKVGIGTTSPHTAFQTEITGTTTWGGGILARGNNKGVVLGELNGVAQIGGHNAAATAWADLAINSGGGNVGIGTTTPQTSLHVADDNAATGGLTIGTGTVGDGGNLRLLSNANHWNLDNVSGSLRFFTETGFGTGGIERFRINNNGFVGIGTSSPKQQLHNTGDYYGRGHFFLHAFEGDGNSGTAYLQARDDSGSSSIGLRFRTQNSGINADAMTISPNTHVGIGTTTPGSQLQVAGGIRARGGSPGLNGVNNNGYAFNGSGGDEDSGMFSTAGGHLQFYTDNIERMRINDFGNVGIGVVIPSERLHVNGNIRLADGGHILGANLIQGFTSLTLRGDASSGTDLGITAGGQVGIGQVYSNFTFNVRGQGSSVPNVFRVELSNGHGVFNIDGNEVLVSGGHDFTVTLPGSKLWTMDHPLDPAHKLLRHVTVESPERTNLYKGNTVLDAAGQATIMLPDYFEALNGSYTYHLTCVGGYAPVYVAREVDKNQFQIAGGTPGLKVSWMITTIMDDPSSRRRPFVPVIEKTGSDIGRYSDPEAYGMPLSLRMGEAEETDEMRKEDN